jgi:NAD(P)-dependent dehydrogenase (short-subunit alcohol dehydrogenase family)
VIGELLGDPNRDLASVTAFLLSDGSGLITGQTIPVDGGRSMVR